MKVIMSKNKLIVLLFTGFSLLASQYEDTFQHDLLKIDQGVNQLLAMSEQEFQNMVSFLPHVKLKQGALN